MNLLQKQNLKAYIEFFFLDRKDLILNSFKFGNLNHYKNIVQEFFDLLDDSEDITIEDTRRIIIEFTLIISNIAYHLDLSMENEMSRFYDNNYLVIPTNHIDWLKKFITYHFDTRVFDS